MANDVKKITPSEALFNYTNECDGSMNIGVLRYDAGTGSIAFREVFQEETAHSRCPVKLVFPVPSSESGTQKASPLIPVKDKLENDDTPRF